MIRRMSARLHVLPLVSKRWARVMKASAEVWEQACVELTEVTTLDPDGELHSLDSAAMAAWFHARPGRIQELGLRCLERTLQLPAAVTSMVLSTQAASLRRLSIDVRAYSLSGPELGVIVAVRGLEALDVRVDRHGFTDRGAAVIRTASRLTALTRLDVTYAVEPGERVAGRHSEGVSLPRHQELVKLRSRSLTWLSMVLDSGSEETSLQLVGLPNLKHCHLLADGSSTECAITSTSFADCTRLEDLSLHRQAGLVLQPGCFSVLSVLTSLTLTECDVQRMPPVIVGLTSLRRLDLSRNKNLLINKPGIDLLRRLKKLRVLNVAHSEPRVQDSYHAQLLFALAQDVRDAGMRLDVTFRDERSDTYQPETEYWGTG